MPSSTPRRQLKLGAFLMPPGHHVAAWRHPSSNPQLGVSFKSYVDIVKKAEAAKFDLVFLADNVAIRDTSAQTGARSSQSSYFEPLTLLSGLAAVTSTIGLTATVSTSFNEPFNLARKFASLDLISDGRAAWNLVTSSTEVEAANFSGNPHVKHAERYERAEEFADVVLKLWGSFEDDAFIRHQESGVFFDHAKLHIPKHKGKHFSVAGPLNIARSPQGHPVLVQAGSSGPGIELAARTAEVVFTAQRNLDEAKAFYATLKGRLGNYGRAHDDLKIMPGVFPVVGTSRDEAEDKFEQLQALIHPDVGVSLLSDMIGGFDLSGYPIDGPVPDLPETNGGKSRQHLLFDLARRENLTIRQLSQKIAGARGHWQITGTAQDIVDQLEERFVQEAADGFNIMPPTLPGGLDDFISLVLPELRRRGLFRTEYEGTTLRENLGLRFPTHAGQRPHSVAA